MNTLELKKVCKIYEGTVSYQALDDMDFTVKNGEFVGVMGPSGSGKSTLLNVISTNDFPTSGQVFLLNQDLHRLSEEELAQFRRTNLGFVFQDFNLMDSLTIRENILLPLALEGARYSTMNQALQEIAMQLGLTGILERFPHEISGGQAQRVAIARAIIHRPSLLLADEPTGNLDSRASHDVLNVLEQMNQDFGVTILMVTHDPIVASHCHRVIFIKDGRIYNEMYRGSNQQAFYQEILNVLSLLGGARYDF
ncbi:putative ABC transport system ATP-binding protein [Thermoactinomyces sp. DSM 45891]|uniref:ABC transporter ATP-binding protein n=1 Tax=Thermoactinomyces sp. DSM 45891 TaxID=1761907 RepID=UPI00092119D2|nr:ABC transporter ATP-binding protein [Thermoactinomyces sp. DSM 45891]SFX21402.1 putative ABC transport system ATP-binding protein [Thermoactinomyces sp. DSM 45891]